MMMPQLIGMARTWCITFFIIILCLHFHNKIITTTMLHIVILWLVRTRYWTFYWENNVFIFCIHFVGAKEIMFLGDWFSAQDAKKMGLVNQIYKQIDLMPEVMKIAERKWNLFASIYPPPDIVFFYKLLNCYLFARFDV